MNRMYYYKNKQEVRLDEMRSKKVDNHLNEFTFQPKVSQRSKNIGKRTVDDLYVKFWLICRIGSLEKMRI